MEPDELPQSLPSQKLKSVIPTKGEIEELTFDDMIQLIKNLKEREKDKSKKPFEIREKRWASLKTPPLTLANLETSLEKRPDAIAILTDTLDVKRPQTSMGSDHEGPISQFTLYSGEEEIDPRVRFNVAFSQQKSRQSQSPQSPADDESIAAIQKPIKHSHYRFMPPETIEGDSLEKILSILKDFNKFMTLGEKALPIVPLSSKHTVAEDQKKNLKAYDMQPVELEIDGKKMTFKYTDAPLKIAYLRAALEDIPLHTITAVLEENVGIPQPYATQGEKSTSLLCRYALYGEKGESLQYKSHSGAILDAVIEMTINLIRD